jgi:hypothetical protein
MAKTNTTLHATGTFKVTSWDEKPTAEVDGAPKLTHAAVTNSYQGDLEAEGRSESLMFYPDDAHATYFGFERVVGRLGGRSGSFVLQGSGTYEDGTATTTWTVVPGSGTGELEGLRGEGGYAAGQQQTEVRYRLAYHFD